MEVIQREGEDELLNVIQYKAGYQRHERECESRITPKFGLKPEDWEIVGPVTGVGKMPRESNL